MSSELNFDNSKEVFSLDKEILSFKLDISELLESEPIKSSISSETEIKITNLTNDYIAFRTKTTKKKYYTVQPSLFVIPPKEIKNVKISFFVKEGEKPKWHGHKFRFEGFVIQPNEKDMEPKNIFSEYIKKGETVIGNSQKTFVRFSCINDNLIEKSPKKSRNLLKLPEISHQRSGSDISEYAVTDENKEIKNENLKTDLLMDKIISNDEQKQTLSDIIIGGETKEEDNNEKDKEIKNDKSEEKKDISISNEKENIVELKKVSDIIESEEIKKKDNNEKDIDKDKEIKSEENKELNDVKEKEKEKIEKSKKEKIDSVENKNIIEKTVSNQNLINNNYLESDKNVSDIEILIALFILMIIGCLLAY